MSPTIDKEYVDTGKVKWVYHVMAFLDGNSPQQESHWAAEAAYCADDQGKFWDMEEKLYDKQGGENAGAYSKANLKLYAQELGLNTQAFNACLDGGKYSGQVNRDNQQGSLAGVSGTPTFFVNGQAVNVMNRDANITISNFRSVLDAALSK